MTHLRIEGGRPLAGAIRVQGSKNVFLHLFAAALLARGKTELHNVPAITDTSV
ncbi:hypothetical protein J0910_30905 [Nocardiopsis sp. CNT-189]|uniref:hypothetical protein n=1 Tax=Nocardiopsis oceanisediminis TaxID=2816862 RepID=UPI003B35A38B